MSSTIAIGLDLGSDTFKVAFAYRKKDEIKYGKLVNESPITSIAIPSVAFYDEDRKEWRFGEEVDDGEGKSFVNIVKINALFSLLRRGDGMSDEVFSDNRNYYSYASYFPKFYFPVRRDMLDNFSDMVAKEMTFEAVGSTPKSVCEDFFRYVAGIVRDRLHILRETHHISNYKLEIALIYPPRVGKAYKSELERMVTEVFGQKPKKVLSTNKALSMYAAHKGLVQRGESISIFNLGEEYLSTAKVNVSNDPKLRVSIEGEDGHNPSVKVGGINVDDAIAKYIEGDIYERETMGTPSYGERGHICEQGLRSKQYLFMNDIKHAKMILSKELTKDSVFAGGVPLSVSRDLYIQRKLTREELKRCVGITGNDGVARQIVEYIEEELARPLNRDVSKIVLVGGVVESYALVDYIREQLAESCPRISCYTFDEEDRYEDSFSIRSNEDSIYAIAVGGAIVVLEDYDVQATLALSYGTWVTVGAEECRGRKFLSLFADRNTLIYDGMAPNIERVVVKNTDSIDDESFYSAIIVKQDIMEMNFEKYPGLLVKHFYDKGMEYGLMITDRRDNLMQDVVNAIGLRIVSGGAEGQILLYHNNRRVYVEGVVYMREGMKIDIDGVAEPFIENDIDANIGLWVNIKYLDNGWVKRGVAATEIELRFAGLKAIMLDND